jgi:hypothetical protein
MSTCAENGNQQNKKPSRLTGALTSVAVLCAIILAAKFLGRQAGRHAAMMTVQQESIAQDAPTGFLGAKWLMSMSRVRSLFPDAAEAGPGNLKLETTAFGRPAFVDFSFTNDLLLMVTITFKGEKTESTYRNTHTLVQREYGAFPEPSSTPEYLLVSQKRVGRVVIKHVLYRVAGMSIEQVQLYRAKETVQERTALTNATPPMKNEGTVSSSVPPHDSRFAVVSLPLGVSIQVPKNWRPFGADLNATIETAGEAATKLAGIEMPAGQKVNLFRANSNPPTTYAGIAINASDSEMSRADVLVATDAEIAELGSTMRQTFEQAFAKQDVQMIRFDGVRREIVDGHPSLVIEYVRSGPQGPVVVQMTRLLIGEKEVSLNLSYRQSEAGLWKPVVAYMRSTFHVSQP